MVLLGDSFGALRPAFIEGRRIVAGLSNAMFLFLTRVVTSTILIIAIAVVGLGFPYEPAQISLTLFTRDGGFLREGPGPPRRAGLRLP